VNPTETLLTDEDGGAILPNVLPYCVTTLACDEVTINCPDSVTVNADCDFPSAIVNWTKPTISSACGLPASLDCGADPRWMTGGEFAIGATGFSCHPTGSAIPVCAWTVTVNDLTSLDVTVQLSPKLVASNLQRCIEFELFSDCVTPPEIVNKDMNFGGALDFVGHFTETIKIPPSGNLVCITARDRWHSLRSCDFLSCDGRKYTAVFKGDPFWGGNWLVNGNLDGWRTHSATASHDVIDILDFGAFVGQYLSTPGKQINCTRPLGPAGATHADINGDNLVDAADFAFVSMNFLKSSKDCCCGSAATLGNTVARTEVSVRELREMGMADLAVADLNNDGLVNMDDMSAFLAGNVPAPKTPVKGRSGGSVRK
jgi:hypothetical protein